MDKKDILEELILYYAEGNKSKMARLLGISPQSISTWLSRNTFDIDLIYAKCENINPEWLLSGKGNMLKKRIGNESLDGSLSDNELNIYNNMYREQQNEIRSLIEEICDLKERLRHYEEEKNSNITNFKKDIENSVVDFAIAGCTAKKHGIKNK